MSAHRGVVGADGRSALPEGVVDSSAGAELTEVPEEVSARLEQIFNEEKLNEVKASYKLEVAINEERSVTRPFSGIVTAWTNGGFLHGGGDEAIYFCPALVEKKGETKTCSAPLSLKWIGKAAAVCPTCRNAVKPSDLAGQVGFKLTFQGWAAVITRMWIALGGDADIRLGVLDGSLHHRTDDVLMRASLSAGDRLDETRLRRKWAIYPLRNIIKDTAAGADLQTRIRVFLGG